MSHFLNREKFNFWIPKLITKAEEEVILIVPYIKTSEIVFKALKKANKDKKRIVIVYRENKLDNKEREKLLSLENLDLLHHPNIHCKCYYNGDILIIGSMNLYEYSEKNNREMGVIFSRSNEVEEKYKIDRFEIDSYNDVEEPLEEVRQIINGATFEKKSKKTKASGFKLNTIQSDFQKALNKCEELNKHFSNKIFRPILEEKQKFSNLEFYRVVCTNYYDNIDLEYDYNRYKIILQIDALERERIFKLWEKDYKEYRFKGFKHYWNWHTQPIYLYSDSQYKFWEENIENYEKRIDAYKKGLKKIFDYYNLLKKR